MIKNPNIFSNILRKNDNNLKYSLLFSNLTLNHSLNQSINIWYSYKYLSIESSFLSLFRRLIFRNYTSHPYEGSARSYYRHVSHVSKHSIQGKEKKIEAKENNKSNQIQTEDKKLKGKDFFSGKSNNTKLFISKEPFTLSLHGTQFTTPIHINYKVLGKHADLIGKQSITSSKEFPIILVAPSMSFNCEVDLWWKSFVGYGNEFAIDLNNFTVICADNFGAPFGTTGTLHLKSGEGGIAIGDNMINERWGTDFPQITPLDQARINKILLDHLKIEKLHAVAGGSLGGMISLWFAAEYPELVDRLFVISTTAKTSPGTVALRRSQRSAILRDPEYNNGRYKSSPKNGMSIAREMGMTFYRSRQEFNERFSWIPNSNIIKKSLDQNENEFSYKSSPFHFSKEVFEVEEYLNRRAQDFTSVYDANAYLIQSRAMDLMDMGQLQWNNPESYNFDDSVNKIKAKTYVIGIKRDNLIPCEEQWAIANSLKNKGKFCIYDELDSRFGHDAFLVDHLLITPRFKAFLEAKF